MGSQLPRRAACSLILICTLVPLARSQNIPTERISVDSFGNEANGLSAQSSINYGGDIIVFSTNANNLVPGGTNGKAHIFIHDRSTGETELVSVSSLGVQANGNSFFPSVSPDGGFIAFTSTASNLVPNDLNGKGDVFLHDRTTGETTIVSVDSNGVQANLPSFDPSISALGTHVSFHSRADNLVPGDTNGAKDVFVHDTETGETVRASLSFVGLQLTKDSAFSSISWDGRYVAFQSAAPNAVFGDINGTEDIFLRDLLNDTTEIISASSSGAQFSNPCRFPTITADGRLVAFMNETSVYVHDRALKATTFEASEAYWATISTNGIFVAFQTDVSLVGGDSNGEQDVYVRDRTQGTLIRASVDENGNQVDEGCGKPTLSGNGHIVSFESSSPSLVSNDNNGEKDIFTHGVFNCAPYDVYCTPSASSILGCTPLISAAGTPSLSNPASFTVTCSSNPGGNNVGMVFFGDNGPSNFNVGTLGGKMCVLPPFERSAPKANGGDPGVCNGFLEYDFQELLSGTTMFSVGKVIHAEFWVRDPDNPDGFVFSNGLQFTVCP